jgi:hypothetical protein
VVGEAGDKLNRLLIKPVTGRPKISSYALPAEDHVYGAPSYKETATLTELLSNKFGPPASPSKRSPDRFTASEDAVFGAPSFKSDDINALLSHKHAPANAGEEPAYAQHLPKHSVGAMPIPRETRTSALRTTKALGELATRQVERDSGKPANESEWKMSRFRDVAPRVPVDGKPLHHPR